MGSSPAKRATLGRLAQLVRAPALHAGGQRFESSTAHHFSSLQYRLPSPVAFNPAVFQIFFQVILEYCLQFVETDDMAKARDLMQRFIGYWDVVITPVMDLP